MYKTNTKYEAKKLVVTTIFIYEKVKKETTIYKEH